MINEYERVKNNFLSGKLKGCKDFFEKHNYFTELGYCYVILDRLDKASEAFNKSKNSDMRANWGLFLVSLLQEQITFAPTYFGIRDFLEIDLNILLLYCKGDFVEKIIKYSDFMAFYNPETYKFIGRAFWANNFFPASMFFLRRAKDTFYNDPELHYLLGYIYYTEEQNLQKADKSLKTCLDILPEYYPAKKLLRIIEE